MKTLFALLILLSTLSLPAPAQTTVADADFHLTNKDEPGLFGNFHVHVLETGSLDFITVRPTGGTISDANTLTTTFYTGLNDAGSKIPILSAFGGTDRFYRVHFTDDKTSAVFERQGTAAPLSLIYFHGRVDLNGGPAKSLNMSIADGGSQTRVLNFQATPEGGSAWLLLAGGLPVVWMLRRRAGK